MTSRAAYLNRALTATITASLSPAFAANGIGNLQLDDRSLYVASSSGTVVISLTWSGATIADLNLALYIGRSNLAFNDQITVTVYPNSDWTGTPVYNSGAGNAYASGLYDNWGVAHIKRYITVTGSFKSALITITSAAVFQAAHLFLGPYTSAPYNPSYGLNLMPGSNAKQSRSEGGSLRGMPKAKWREMAFDMLYQTEADRAAWWEIARYCDIDKPLLYDTFPNDASATNERDHCIFGKFESAPGTKIADVSRFDQSVKIKEA